MKNEVSERLTTIYYTNQKNNKQKTHMNVLIRCIAEATLKHMYTRRWNDRNVHVKVIYVSDRPSGHLQALACDQVSP